VAVFDVITERKKEKEALRESEERFRAIFEQAAVGVALLNTKTGQFIRINQKYCDFVGYTMQEMLHKTFMDITYNEDVQLNVDKNAKLIEDDSREFSFEKRYVHKNGNIFWGNITISPLWKVGEKPETFFHIAIVEDINERKKDELIIRQQNIQLRELNAAKDKFFSIIAHDLRSPFQVFLGLTKSLAEEANDYTIEELNQIGNDLNQLANNLFGLLKNLLEWAQMQKGSMSFQPNIFSLSDQIAENVQILKRRGEQKGITIINTISGSLQVYADEKMINSVLLNLLSNAIKFTHKNGTVTISALKTDDDLVKIAVSDTGIGIEKNMGDKLFKIGEKTNRTGTDGELSSGLGLLLCKEFVEKNGGTIWVESEEGKGSTFSFTIPDKDGRTGS
jgi:PAS domain S-box-containing protein